MATNTISGEDIYAQLQNDPEFAAQPQGVQEAMRPFILAIPDVLADLLDKPVTLGNVMRAKLLFIQSCLDGGFIRAAVAALPSDQLEWFGGAEGAASMLESTLSEAIPMIEQLTDPGTLSKLLAENGVTEEQIMLSNKVSLNPEALARYQTGNMTISDLLLTQPMVIIKNT